jgi:serine/threonine protein kinase
MSKQLVIIAGQEKDRGRTFPLPEGGTVQIGRGATTTTKLNDLRASRNHCVLQIDGGEVTVVDANSQEGTFVNNQRITAPVPLQFGDVIRVGATELRLDPLDVASEKTMAGIGFSPPSSVPPREGGTDLLGKALGAFRILEVLAAGDTSTVFRVRDTRDDREVALKVFRAEHSKSDAEMDRLVRTLQPLLGLRHPNLVALYGAGKTGPHCWVAMELVEGENLAQLIERAGAAGMVDWQHALRVAVHLARALEYLHKHQFLHRNVLPVNILVNKSDKATKLGAVMKARPMGAPPEPGPGPTEMLRDLAFMPPERVRGNAPGDHRSDIYSLGATLFNLLTGQPPFAGKTMPEVIAKLLQNEPARPREFQMTMPEAFEQAVLRMMARRPEDRYPTAAEVLVDLERVTRSPTPTTSEVSAGGGPRFSDVGPRPASFTGTATGTGTGLLGGAPQMVLEGRISVTCTCGQTLQAREKYAGTRVRCPACGALVLLPGSKVALQGTGESTTEPPGPPPPTWQGAAIPPVPDDPAVQLSLGKLMAIVAGTVVFVVLLLGGILLAWKMLKSSPPASGEVDKKTETARRAYLPSGGEAR